MSDSVEFRFDRGPGGKVNVVAQNGAVAFADRVDPGSAVSRGRFLKSVREALPAVDHVELERRLLELAAPQQQAAASADDPGAASDKELARMPQHVRDDALAMLQAPDLLRRVMVDVSAVGVVGEFELALTLYLIGTSRLLDKPVNGIVQGASSSGKSHVIERIGSMFPREAALFASDLTANALYYLPEGALRHRFVVCGERSRVEDDGRAEVTRALREMLSSGVLRKVLPVKKDDQIETVIIESKGPIAFVESTTLGTLFAEDRNRCLLLSSDDGAEQTRRVLEAIGDFYATGSTTNAEQVVERHHAAQRLLRRCRVVVPFARQLAASMPTQKPEARRALHHALNVVSAVTLLFQFQRCTEPDHGVEINATIEDYSVARRLLLAPLARSLGGGLPGHVVAFHDWLASATVTGQAFAVQDMLTMAGCRWEKTALYDMTRALRACGGLHDAGQVGRAMTYRLPPGGLASAAADWLPLPEVLA